MSAFPSQVQIMLTERCNLTCAHCAVPAEDSPADHELPAERWREFVEQLAGEGLRDLVISGGEAMLRRDALELAAHAHEVGVRRTTIVTNGHLLRGRAVDAIVAAQERFEGFGLHVSIDGASAETHDWMRGPGSFATIRAGIDRLRAAGGRVTGVHTVFHRGNVHEFDAMGQLARALGASTWTIFPIASVGRGTRLQAFVLDEPWWRDLYRRIEAARVESGLDIAPMGPIYADEWPMTEGAEIPRPRASMSGRICVGPDGAVFTCPPLRHVTLGTVAVDRWSTVAEAGRDLLERTCPRCRFLLLCTGGRTDGGWATFTGPEPIDPGAHS